MNALRTVVVLVCAAVVALPLSPCAFFSSTCCADEAERAVEPVVEERACCAQHEAPQPSDREHRDQPCSRVCCLLSPFVPVDKVLADAPAVALFAVLPPVADVEVQLLAFAPVETPQPVPLQILHCQWRR